MRSQDFPCGRELLNHMNRETFEMLKRFRQLYMTFSHESNSVMETPVQPDAAMDLQEELMRLIETIEFFNESINTCEVEHLQRTRRGPLRL